MPYVSWRQQREALAVVQWEGLAAEHQGELRALRVPAVVTEGGMN